MLLNATTRRDTQGQIIGVVGVGQDITEIDRYRQQMETTANELTQLIDTANAPIFGVDTDGLINEWNQQVAQTSGYSKEEVMGQNLVEVYITPDYKQSVQQVLDQALLGSETDNYQVPLTTKDGREVMMLLNATTRRDTQGQIIGVVAVCQDILGVDHSVQQLECPPIEQNQMIDTANAPILWADTAGLNHAWNQ